MYQKCICAYDNALVWKSSTRLIWFSRIVHLYKRWDPFNCKRMKEKTARSVITDTIRQDESSVVSVSFKERKKIDNPPDDDASVALLMLRICSATSNTTNRPKTGSMCMLLIILQYLEIENWNFYLSHRSLSTNSPRLCILTNSLTQDRQVIIPCMYSSNYKVDESLTKAQRCYQKREQRFH